MDARLTQSGDSSKNEAERNYARNQRPDREGGPVVTRIPLNAHVVRETGTLVRRRPLVIELHALMLRVRLKGARWAYDVDYESIFELGARKAAEKVRAERLSGSNRRRNRSR